MNINKLIKEEREELSSKIKKIDSSNMLNGIIEDFDNEVNRFNERLTNNFPYSQEIREYKSYQNSRFELEDLQKLSNSLSNVKKKARIPFQRSYWSTELRKLNFSNDGKSDSYQNEYQLLEKQLLIEWKKSLDKLKADWELEEVNKFRKRVLKEFLERVEKLKRLKESLSNLDLGYGYLWDLAKGDLKASDYNLLEEWLEFLESNQEIKELCEILGRLKQYIDSSKMEKVAKISMINRSVPDINSQEEICGIKLSNEIEHVLPQELSLLNDEATAILFDLKLLENKLMCFDFQGNMDIEEENIEEVYESIEEEKKGPVILCIDTSGSMHGTPENVAKAIALMISSKAISENRSCLIINFSTTIEVLEMDKIGEIGKLFNFLKKSFYGGTDLLPALKYSLDKMNGEKFKRSDVMVISDFILKNLPQEILNEVFTLKEKGNKFYSISIGDLFLDNKLRDVFDTQWIYNPRSSSIEILNGLNEIV